MFVTEQLRNVKRVLKRTPSFVGRNLTVFEDDVFVTSYPKSGNTWTRFLIGNLLYQNEDINFSNIEKKIPDIYQNTDRQLLGLARPRMIKSHECFDPRYKKVIFIVRDPRDVLVSTYYHYIKYGSVDESLSINDFGKGFLYNQYNGVGQSNVLGSWGENVGSWLGAHENSTSFLLIRYEDLKTDINAQLLKITNFLGVSCSATAIEAAITNSSIKHMRTLERQETNVWPARQTKRKDIPFVRSASSGGWKEALSDELVDDLQQAWGSTMETLGYL